MQRTAWGHQQTPSISREVVRPAVKLAAISHQRRAAIPVPYDNARPLTRVHHSLHPEPRIIITVPNLIISNPATLPIFADHSRHPLAAVGHRGGHAAKLRAKIRVMAFVTETACRANWTEPFTCSRRSCGSLTDRGRRIWKVRLKAKLGSGLR